MGGWPARCGVEELTPLTGGGATLVAVSIRRHPHKQFQGRALSSVEGEHGPVLVCCLWAYCPFSGVLGERDTPVNLRALIVNAR